MTGSLTLRSLALCQCCLALCCLLAAGGAAAQEKAAAPPGLALWVKVAGRPQPMFMPVHATGGSTHWLTVFPRLPHWKEPEGVLPILAVRFALRMDGGRANVRVTVHRGVKFYDVEEFVAEYSAAAGDSYVVKELEKFGVQPFAFSVVRRAEAAPPAVGARYLTSSLEVVSAEADQGDSALKLVLRNLSPKPVMALKLETRKGRMRLSTMWPLGKEGRPIIEPGGVGEVRLGYGGGAEKAGEGYAPNVPEMVVVASALFADGSYEGELQAAAHAAAQYAGYRLQLKGVLELVRQALDSPDVDAPGAAAGFKEKVLALGRDAEPYAVDEVLNAYPDLAEGERESVKAQVEVAMSWLRRDVLAQLVPFEGNGAGRGISFRRWLTDREKQFGEWLARLPR